ncbi:MAG: hypothetical protein UY98_C0005G0025 [Candidatus Kaiserbacteria bacterium GW2011_GWA2_58_9]|uniref:Secreted protein n=1 Tax=Candidatus Kaiserbacteria bacterium GW2011_GWA2_58_9 TaxID=1618672 RepID=A0A0G1YWJ9_9BACT|nr:MAG: hypothetical protein UY98_C0005G0025 [Candidatus Kaiserbacteria bacterium GW2011_GWA2_58_9]
MMSASVFSLHVFTMVAAVTASAPGCFAYVINSGSSALNENPLPACAQLAAGRPESKFN